MVEQRTGGAASPSRNPPVETQTCRDGDGSQAFIRTLNGSGGRSERVAGGADQRAGRGGVVPPGLAAAAGPAGLLPRGRAVPAAAQRAVARSAATKPAAAVGGMHSNFEVGLALKS